MPSVGARALTSVSAACALSFITSPSWPVRISLPLPGHARRLDEQDVAADRRPGEAGGDARARWCASRLRASKRRRPRIACRSAAADATCARRCPRRCARRRAGRRADLALEVAHAGLARVVADDGAQRLVGDLALLGGQPGRRELARHQVALGDLQLLLLGVAGQLDDLHAVAQRPGNRVEHVGGADEHHLRQVERHGEVVVAERRVLLGVEHFEQRRRRVAVEAAAPSLSISSSIITRIARAGLADRSG